MKLQGAQVVVIGGSSGIRPGSCKAGTAEGADVTRRAFSGEAGAGTT
jgi:NAD(P)-dependent dehydrogenase (short-subunit alcohol dehydrogenase family)